MGDITIPLYALMGFMLIATLIYFRSSSDEDRRTL